MSISAVGFLFQSNNGKGISKEKNYTCGIYKRTSGNTFKKDTIVSPDNRIEKTEYITPDIMYSDLVDTVNLIGKNKSDKFIGAAIKDGIRETEIHSMISDDLYAVRTKDERGKNQFRLMGLDKTRELLAKNLGVPTEKTGAQIYLTA